MPRYLLLIPVLFFLAACDGGLGADEVPDDFTAAPPEDLFALIDSAALRQHIEVLADDRFMGRAPGTPGESLAVEYIAEQMREAGLQPAGENGTYFQRVPLLGSTPSPGPLRFRSEGGEQFELDFVEDYIVSTDLEDTQVSVEAPVVFVGYGIDSPADGWNDFEGVDVEDKVLLAFVNDPIATEEDPNLFQGDTLTYFGRWTYKQEEARRKGARGIILIHTLPTAGYPFTVLSGGAAGEQIQLAEPPEDPLAMKAWITKDSAERLAQMVGATVDGWFFEANDPAFEPRELPVTVSLDADYAVRRFSGRNVLGKVEGRTLADEVVAYTAHHDHLGVGAPVRGDSIYNGAIDNATGVSMLLTTGRTFAAQDPPPARTVLFASVTAEESGLLGAAYYARNPVYPLAQTVANINLDGGNVYGATEDIVGIGAERSDMMRLLEDAAAEEGLTVSPDQFPNQGLFFRSDQLAFARGGVPAVFLQPGGQYVGQDEDYAQRMEQDYNANRYHKPGDEFDPAWPMSGLVQQARVAFRMGYRLANSRLGPAWREGEGFGEVRRQSLAGE